MLVCVCMCVCFFQDNRDSLKHRHFFHNIHSMNTHDDVVKWKHFPRYWPGEFPAQRPVTRSFGVFLDLRLNQFHECYVIHVWHFRYGQERKQYE